MNRPSRIRPADGKLGVLLPGLGAVATTTIAGVMLARRGLGEADRLAHAAGHDPPRQAHDGRAPKIKDFVPLATLDDLEFGGWDLFPDDAYESARRTPTCSRPTTSTPIKDELERVRPMRAVFYPEYVKRLHGTHVKQGADQGGHGRSSCATTSAPS